ncbi:PEPxxWA-CTERM sorting domain-containing protein [Phenylobacterium sp.]|uniref:PEPxxWA-CTERM sorting domain-containing protein n=1 Tax=Phenylobacterium sp. TaxID=1871053 RepID=UPI00289BC5C2|nr:PEPxxWA-CTERM sorting domain-containing protein [Phenylobacterium sp.]
MLFGLLLATIVIPLPAMTPALLSSALGAMSLVATPVAGSTQMVPVYFMPARGRPKQVLLPETQLAGMAEPRSAIHETSVEQALPFEAIRTPTLYEIDPRLPSPWHWLVAPDPAAGPRPGGPLPRFPTPVPEPSTWAMLITGFVMAGAVIRRRRGAAAAALV